jgi:diguanylate cyclase (GGDEF)-like protein
MTDFASIEQGDDFWARVRMALGALRPPAREQISNEGPAALARQIGIEEELGRSWAMAAARKVSMSLLVIEIDRMSEFFAAYGKEATDRCVRQVMRAVADALPRDGDLCLRMGQATFIVALPDLPLVLARNSAGQIAEAIRKLGVAHKESHAGVVTASMGLAVVNPRGEYEAGFFEAAAGALKKAQRKGLGRLQVVDLRPAEERKRRAA